MPRHTHVGNHLGFASLQSVAFFFQFADLPLELSNILVRPQLISDSTLVGDHDAGIPGQHPLLHHRPPHCFPSR